MLVTSTSHTSLELTDPLTPELRFEGGHGIDPIDLFITSIGMCAFSVLAAYAEQIEVPADHVRLSLEWRYATEVNRIEHISLRVHWPELPRSRAEAARRAAETCTLHRTLERLAVVETELSVGSEDDAHEARPATGA